MSKPSIRRAIVMAKTVKLQLASAAESSTIKITSEDKAKAYAAADRKQGLTPVDRANKLKYERDILKMIGFKLYD